jgi:hypothetical protein
MAFGLFGKRVPEPAAPAFALHTGDGNPIIHRGIKVTRPRRGTAPSGILMASKFVSLRN